jgi:hypothetical protein
MKTILVRFLSDNCGLQFQVPAAILCTLAGSCLFSPLTQTLGCCGKLTEPYVVHCYTL